MPEGLQQNVKNMETRNFHNLTFSYAFSRSLLCIQGFTEYLQYHIGLQLHTCFINFDLVTNFEKIEKNNFSSDPCFLNLPCWKRHNQGHIKYCFKHFLQALTSWCVHHRFAKVQLANGRCAHSQSWQEIIGKKLVDWQM